MTIKKVKAIELIFDWNLWPRHDSEDLDSTNLSRMKTALIAGITLPPIIINKKDNRIIDGFHRTKTVLNLYGDEAEIMADIRDYKNDAEMFLESVRVNNNHGLPLSPKDRTGVILKARKFKIPVPIIAEALGMDIESAKRFLEKRSARTKSGEVLPLSGGCLSLAGKTLTDTQENYVRGGVPGTSAQLYARLLLNALNADAVVYTDKIVETLKELNIKIESIISEVAI